jgi:hypothetical protein
VMEVMVIMHALGPFLDCTPRYAQAERHCGLACVGRLDSTARSTSISKRLGNNRAS